MNFGAALSAGLLGVAVIAATVVAIQGVERELIWSARNMGANQRELLTQIVLPAALPQIMTGLQVAPTAPCSMEYFSSSTDAESFHKQVGVVWVILCSGLL